MSAKSDETQLAVCRGPKPTPCDHLLSAPAETVASSACPRSAETVREKLYRLGEAPIQRRNAESPRHRSARVPNAEASNSSRSLPPRPACRRSDRLHRPPKRDPRAPASVPSAEATDPSDLHCRTSTPPKRRFRTCLTLQPPKRPSRRNTASRRPKPSSLDETSVNRR
jgi:hypothetical protein